VGRGAAGGVWCKVCWQGWCLAAGEAAVHLRGGADPSLPSFPVELAGVGSHGVVLLGLARAQLAREVPGSRCSCVLVQLRASHQRRGNKTMRLVQWSCGTCSRAERCSGNSYAFAGFSNASRNFPRAAYSQRAPLAGCRVMAVVPERLSPTRHRNAAGLSPGKGSMTAWVKN